MNFPDLTDRIHEASVLPEQWEDLLVDISHVCGAQLGTVFTSCTSRVTSIVTPGSEQVLQAYAEGNWDSINSRVDRGRKLNHAGFFTDHDVFTEEELRSEPFYTDFVYPHGLGRFAGTLITTPNDDVLAMSFDRARSQGPFPQEAVAWLDSLRPHLARSLSLTARLKERVAAAITDTLGAFGLPACLVDARGRMRAANALMSPLVPSYIADRRDRVRLSHLSSDQLLGAALEQRPTGRTVSSVPVPPVEDLPASVIHVVPVAGRGRDLFPTGLNILAVSFAGSSAVPDARVLRGLFDLTPAEAKVAGCIAHGAPPGGVAQETGMASNTVKAHLKAVYSKTGVSHYGELVRLLCGMAI